jgi:hypothetical protein
MASPQPFIDRLFVETQLTAEEPPDAPALIVLVIVEDAFRQIECQGAVSAPSHLAPVRERPIRLAEHFTPHPLGTVAIFGLALAHHRDSSSASVARASRNRSQA